MNTIATAVPGNATLIEPATWRDLSSVRSLEQTCFPLDAWPLLDLIGILTFPRVIRLKATADGRMVGFIGADVRPLQKLAWIATIGVLPEYRRRGIATALIQACEERVSVPSIRLNVRLSNRAAIHLYRRLGYHEVGMWEKYYQDGEAALVFEKRFL